VGHKRRGGTNTNGGTSTVTYSIYTGGGGPGEGTESWTIGEGANHTAWFHADITYDSTSPSCTYKVLWRYQVNGPTGKINETEIFCCDSADYVNLYATIESCSSYCSLAYSELVAGDAGGGLCTPYTKRSVNPTKLVKNKDTHLEEIGDFKKRDEYSSDGNEIGACGPDLSVPCDPVPYSPTQMRYQANPDAIDPPSRVFLISSFGVFDFDTTEPTIATIQASFGLSRSEICTCDLGISVNNIIEQSSITSLTLPVPYDFQQVSIYYSTILPTGQGNNIALAYLCNPNPQQSDVYFDGSPSMTVDLVSLFT